MTLGMPDWASEIPSAPVHQENRGELVRPFTAQQLIEFGKELIEQFLKRVVLGLAGFFIPGMPSFEQLVAWADDLREKLADVPILGDLIEAITGVEDGDLNDLGTFFLNVRTFLASINFLDPSFNLGAALTQFASLIVPLNIFSIPADVQDSINGALGDLQDALDGSYSGSGPIFLAVQALAEAWLKATDPLNAANLFGRIGMPQLAGGVSLADLTTATSNLLDPFTAESVPSSDGWSFNATEDAAQVVFDGSTKGLWLKSGVIKVEEGQPVNTTVKVKYSGVVSGAGDTIRYVLETYESEDGSGPMVPVVVDAITNPTGTISSPVTLGDTSWDPPPGVQSVRPLLEGDELITAGTGYWMNTPVFRKTLLGVLSDGLPAALQKPLDDLQATWDKFKGAAGGTVDDIEDALNDAGQAIRDAIANALGHAGTGHTSANILTYLQNIPQTVVSGLGDLNTLTNQIRDILAGLVVTPINSTVQAIKDWFTGVVGKTQNLTSGGNLPPTNVGGVSGGSIAQDIEDTWNKFWDGIFKTTGSTGKTAADVKTAATQVVDKADAAQSAADQIVEDTNAGWTGGTPSGTPTAVYDTITEIRNAVSGVYTVEVKTTSGTWTNPGGIVEFWAICIGSGNGGSGGSSSASGGIGAGGDQNTLDDQIGATAGKYLAQQINPADLGSTESYTVPAGGSGGAAGSIVNGGVGAAATFGSHASSATAVTGAIAGLVGYYNADSSSPGYGGAGGSVATDNSSIAGGLGRGTPLAAGGVRGAVGGGTGGAGGTASMTGQTRCGGGGGGGGGGNGTGKGGNGGAGGFPGGGGGGGGAGRTSGGGGGTGGNGGNGVVVLIYR